MITGRQPGERNTKRNGRTVDARESGGCQLKQQQKSLPTKKRKRGEKKGRAVLTVEDDVHRARVYVCDRVTARERERGARKRQRCLKRLSIYIAFDGSSTNPPARVIGGGKRRANVLVKESCREARTHPHRRGDGETERGNVEERMWDDLQAADLYVFPYCC